ncbi:MAG: TRC40/GET3/ArsA family transport-energizing ATPase [Acidobacteriota bacterium]
MTYTDLLGRATRILFFTGKGGVGKTSLACATALVLAESGKRILLVSTDPASNLDEVLGVELTGQPMAVPGAAGLCALNIDPEASAKAYRERVVGPYRGVLPDAAVNSIEEQLSGACTVEIAAFDEFTKLLGDAHATSEFDHILFDTAPTGHTLRLLKLPGAWTGFIATNTTGTSCLGPLAGLQAQRSLYESSLRALADGSTSTVVLVSRPEPSALTEADRTRAELSQIGVSNQCLILNGLFVAQDQGDPAARALEARGRQAVEGIPAGLAALPRLDIPLLAYAPMGIAQLRGMLKPGTVSSNQLQTWPNDRSLTVAARKRATDPQQVTEPRPSGSGRSAKSAIGSISSFTNFGASRISTSAVPLSDLIDDIEEAGHGVVLTMGKGGVGKTTVASAIAIELAHRGHRVHLSTTDPAAHLAVTVGEPVPKLQVSRIDPAVETARYTAEVMARSAAQLDAEGIALLEEDLRSPCTEEIAVFSAFARTVAEGEECFVVLDTAPTGHTLLLLDAAEAYHRDVARTTSDVPEAVRKLLPRLRDARFTRVLLVTLPEATPVHEAARLREDLLRAGIQPFAWVVNQSFAGDGFRDPVLVERGARELPFIAEVRERFSSRLALVPWSADAPVGPERLRRLANSRAD